MKKLSTLNSRKFYKVKNPTKNFLCALCSAPRSLKYNKHLKSQNYLQIALLSVATIWLLYPYIGEKSLFSVFLIWMAFEFVNKSLYRKDIPCPYCGFDATWYRRDVKVAHKKVQDYWRENYPDLVSLKVGEDQEQKAEQTNSEH